MFVKQLFYGKLNAAMGIGSNIKRLREKANLTREKLVYQCKGAFSISHLAKVESESVKSPGIEMLTKIADALVISLDELVGREPPKK